jgi:hypothetical protein
MTQKQQLSHLFLSWRMLREQWMSHHLLHICQQQLRALLQQAWQVELQLQQVQQHRK